MLSKKAVIVVCTLYFALLQIGIGQSSFESWHTANPNKEDYPGISVAQMYQYLQGRKSQKTIVAVIDSGVDINHEDLKEVIWVNRHEIPNNKIDDDKNGYVDDINGWNFIGGKDGSHVAADNLEITRHFRTLKHKFQSADPSKIKGKDKKSYQEYLDLKTKIESEQKSAEKNLEETEKYEYILSNALGALKKALGNRSLTQENVEKLDEKDNIALTIGKQIFSQISSMGEEIPKDIDSLTDLIMNDIREQKHYFETKAKYQYNPDYDSRKVVGDDYGDLTNRYYGNNDVVGPDPSHGTHVSGIIAASRLNEKGIQGIADNVEIMVLRTVPDGDERDKDVANAIRYAVDNGARIINMSFGKGLSPVKKYVDDALKHAMKHDVLLVHASGNDASDNDNVASFPTDKFSKAGLFGKKYADNWLEVGASSFQKDEDLVADFSNYGQKNVDIFAPGVSIYSTNPGSTYKAADGTSFAAPVVAGVAAVIRSYFPSLSANQVKEAILSGGSKYNSLVKKPGTEEMVKLSDISVTGAVINAYEAVRKANFIKQSKGKESAPSRA